MNRQEERRNHLNKEHDLFIAHKEDTQHAEEAVLHLVETTVHVTEDRIVMDPAEQELDQHKEALPALNLPLHQQHA